MSDFMYNILPYRQQADVINGWLKERLDNLLPRLMRSAGIDMWIVACHEYNEDPVFLTLLPEPVMSASRFSVLVFALQEDGTLSRYAITRANLRKDLYQRAWDNDRDQWLVLKDLIEKHQPAVIGLNYSKISGHSDGLSVSLLESMKDALSEYSSRFASAEQLSVAWLETRTENELTAYNGIVAITHRVIKEAFSNRVIHPGITTDTDLSWWIRQRFEELGLKPWFQPSIIIQRHNGVPQPDSVILPGDLLHCDVGFTYLRLCSDIQNHAYVLKRGESEPPQGLQAALKAGIRLQDIIADEMIAGGSGNEILRRSRDKAQAEGLVPCVYPHPIGFHGHGAGALIGYFDCQDGVPGIGDFELHDSTCYALESNIRFPIPEWNGQQVMIALEQTVAVKDGRVWFLDGRQEHFHLI